MLRLSPFSLLSARHISINLVYYCDEHNVNSFAAATKFVLAGRSKAWVCGCSPAEIVGSNSAVGTYVCCVLLGTGLCVGLITRPEESYRVWCFVVCDLATSWMGRSWPTGGGGCCAKKKETKYLTIFRSGFYQLRRHKSANISMGGMYFSKLRRSPCTPKARKPLGYMLSVLLTMLRRRA